MEEFVDSRNPSPGEDPPVTAVASRRVKPGREQEFEEWVSGILAAANKFPGYLGSEVLRPSRRSAALNGRLVGLLYLEDVELLVGERP